MKKFTEKLTEKHRLNYFFAFLAMWPFILFFGYNLAMHLRIYNVLWFLFSLITARSLYICSKKGVRPDIYECRKKQKEWRDRKKAAEKAGEDFNEKYPVTPDRMTGYIGVYFVGYVVSLIVVIWLSLPLYALIPFHWPHEYKNERPKTIGEINFFPEDIPKGAKNVKWEVMPSFLQATGHYILTFNADDAFIEDTVTKYGGKAVETERCIDSKRTFVRGYGENSVLYTMYERKDSNHPWYEGFVVNDEKNLIVYSEGSFGQYWAY